MCIPFQTPVCNGGVRWYGGHAWHGTGRPGGRKHFRFRGKNYKVARVVCEAFNGPEPFPGAYVLHDDEDNQNNRSGNLVWGTQKQNLNYPKFRQKNKQRMLKQWEAIPASPEREARRRRREIRKMRAA